MNEQVKIISGGQTGADMGGLIAAEQLGIPTSGTAPKGFKTEDGANPDLKTRFGLNEGDSADYKVRTKSNINDSDVTLIYATEPNSKGTKLTVDTCKKYKKPFVIIDPNDPLSVKKTKVTITNAMNRLNRPVTVNVAGNRESKSPGIQKKVIDILTKAFELIESDKKEM